MVWLGSQCRAAYEIKPRVHLGANGRRRRGVTYMLHGERGGTQAKRRAARQKFIKQNPKTVNVGSGSDRLALAAGHFRSHVTRRARDNRRVAVQTAGIERGHQPETGEDRLASLG